MRFQRRAKRMPRRFLSDSYTILIIRKSLFKSRRNLSFSSTGRFWQGTGKGGAEVLNSTVGIEVPPYREIDTPARRNIRVGLFECNESGPNALLKCSDFASLNQIYATTSIPSFFTPDQKTIARSPQEAYFKITLNLK